MLLALAIFGVAGYYQTRSDSILVQAIAACIGLFFVGLGMFFHHHTGECPVCHNKFADSKEYGFGDTPGLSLTDVVPNCPFCNVELDGEG